MRGWGYVQERREWKSAVLWGNENRMWHDSKPDSLSLPSSPTTQSGFEVRFYLAPLTLTFLTQFCTTHCVTANSLSCEHRQPHRSTHLLWRDEEKQQESQSLHWLFPPLTVLPTKHKNENDVRVTLRVWHPISWQKEAQEECVCVLSSSPPSRTCSHTCTSHPWLCLMSLLLMSSLAEVAPPSIHRRWWHNNRRRAETDSPWDACRTPTQSHAAAAGTLVI